MKKNHALLLCFGLCFVQGFAQHNVFSAGSTQTLTITTGTVFSADSLVLTPSSNFTIASNALLETPISVIGVPNNSISRVFYLNNPVNYSGTIQVYYRPAELNGNIESSLQFSDSTTGSWWLVSASSTVNTTSHFVQFHASNEMFVAATATQSGTVLPLKLLSFSGVVNGNDVDLAWTIDQNEQSKNFTVQRSPDGKSWQDLGVIDGSQTQGIYQYHFQDLDGALSTRLYRIMITTQSEKSSYSSTIRIASTSDANTVYVAANHNSATIYFIGSQPRNVCVMNAAGQIIYINKLSSQHYEIDHLLPGLYFAAYELNGSSAIKKFAVW